jgi:hypothetical protein
MVYAGDFTVTAPDTGKYKKGQSFPGAGYGWLQIKVMDNVGGSDINVTVSYVDQGGNAEIANTPTLIPASTYKDTFIDVILNPGDLGAREVTDASITGGVAGDIFEFHLFYFSKSIGSQKSVKELFLIETQSGRVGTGKAVDENKSFTDQAINPQIQSPVPVLKVDKVFFEPEPLTGTEFIMKMQGFIRCLYHAWLAETLAGRVHNSRIIRNYRAWLESVVGQVVSGHVRDQDNSLIQNAFKVLLTSSFSFGRDIMGDVDPQTAVYQVFMKDTIYDRSFLLVNDPNLKNDLLYRQHGSLSLDGRERIDVIDLKFERKDESLKRIRLGRKKKGESGLYFG